MPLDKEKKLLFIHIPKTGGTSIEHFFGMTRPENFHFARWDRDQHDFVNKHKHLNDSHRLYYEPQHYPVNVLKDIIKDYDEYFKFAFVRNPYTRLLSEYYWQKQQTLKYNYDFDPNDFHDWCLSFLADINSSHKESQSGFIDDSIDFIGKYEFFDHDFERLQSAIAAHKKEFIASQNAVLPKINTTGIDKEALIARIFSETREAIYQTYKEDFIQFGYDDLTAIAKRSVAIRKTGNQLLSVVIPIVRFSEHINQCIQSVLDSDFESDKMEIIIVDDSGNDNSFSILNYLTAHSNVDIKIIRNDIRLGLTRSRNRGVANSNGDFLFFLDADNYIHKNCFKKHFEMMAQNDGITACYAPVQLFYNTTSEFLSKRSDKPFDYKQLLEGNYIDAMAMFRKNDFVEAGMFDNIMPAYGWDDYELWLRLGKMGKKVVFIADNPLSWRRKYHIGESNDFTSDQYNILVYYLKQKYPIKLRLRKSETLESLVQHKKLVTQFIRRLKKYL